MLHVRSLAIATAAAGTAILLAAGPAVAQGSWTIVSAPPTGENGELAAVAAVSGTDAWAVGTTNAELNGVGAKPLIDNWNGTAWTQVTAPATPGNTAYLTAVSASSTTDAWAVGRTQQNREDFAPVGLHWNGTAWSVSPSLATALGGQIGDGVADISPTDAYAIGGGLGSAHSGLVAKWNGSTWTRVTWSVVPMPLEPGTNPDFEYVLNSVQVNSPTDVWAVGEAENVATGSSATLTEHWNGTEWSVVPSPSPGAGAALTGVTTSNAANDVWAVGNYTPSGTTETQTLTLNWNGTAWSTVASPDNGSPSVLLSVSTNPGGPIVWAVGSSGSCCSRNPLVLQNG